MPLPSPVLLVGRAVSFWLTSIADRQDALISGILDGRATPALELQIWNQALNVLVAVATVEHVDNAVPSAPRWDWMADTDVLEPNFVSVGRVVTYQEGGGVNCDAIVAAKLDNRAVSITEGPALELWCWKRETAVTLHIPSIEYRYTVAGVAPYWRGLDE